MEPSGDSFLRLSDLAGRRVDVGGMLRDCRPQLQQCKKSMHAEVGLWLACWGLHDRGHVRLPSAGQPHTQTVVVSPARPTSCHLASQES